MTDAGNQRGRGATAGVGTDAGGDADGTRDEGPWVSLFSGGKDSSWALYRALERGLPVERLVTVHPSEDAYMYHVPATRLAELAAESIGIPLVDVDAGDLGADEAVDAGAQGDRELEPLERALEELADDLGGIAGRTARAGASEDHSSPLQALADRLGADVFAPLWREDPVELGESMLDAGFEIRIVQVAARGLDESWLGRRLDRDALADLERLNDEYGVHPLGEGGEFETLVVDGPHMDRRIGLAYGTEWDGTRGRLRITGASLE